MNNVSLFGAPTSTMLRLALANITSSAPRSASIIISISILTALVFGNSLISYGVESGVENSLQKLGADLLIAAREEDPIAQFLMLGVRFQEVILVAPPKRAYLDIRAVESKLLGVAGIAEVAPQLYVGEVEISGSSYPVMAIDPEKDFTVKAWLSRGSGEALRGGSALIGSGVPAPASGHISLGGAELKIAGVLEESGTGLDGMVIILLDDAYVLAEEDPSSYPYRPGQATGLLIRIDPGLEPDEVVREIREELPELSLVSVSGVTSSVKKALSGIAVYTSLMGFSLWAMTTVLISTILSMAINERRSQLGVLRAIGLRVRGVFMLVVLEALLLSLVGGSLGITSASIAFHFSSEMIPLLLGVPYLWPSLEGVATIALQAMAVASSTAVLASLYPASVASRLDPYDAIRRGG